jgi:hypothetical protein
MTLRTFGAGRCFEENLMLRTLRMGQAASQSLINGINPARSAVLSTPLQGLEVPAPDTLHEFKGRTKLDSAEFGQARGTSVNLVTQSGTNQFYGMGSGGRMPACNLCEFFRNQ